MDGRRGHLRNDGPSVTGELRLDGGTQSRTQYGTPVDLPTGSDKIYLLYAQPPGFGREIKVDLVEGDDEIASARAEYAVRDAAQLVVGIVAERPQGIVTGLSLLPNQQQQAAVTLALTPADLPSRVEAWSAIDRLVWQDVDSNLLEPEQLAALQGWLASGGRLVIAGGTAGPATLSAFPTRSSPTVRWRRPMPLPSRSPVSSASCPRTPRTSWPCRATSSADVPLPRSVTGSSRPSDPTAAGWSRSSASIPPHRGSPRRAPPRTSGGGSFRSGPRPARSSPTTAS